jgi:alpha-tubulin suppressor-like RCC1 family protein
MRSSWIVLLAIVAATVTVGLTVDVAAAAPAGEMGLRQPAPRLSASPEGAHTCLAAADGALRCWGANGSGQLGLGDTNPRLAPTQVPGLTNVASVAAGKDHTCALLANGTVLCWGSNASGQLGVGQNVTGSSAPMALNGLSGVTSITAGSVHTCARLATGEARCWGFSQFGQVGDGTTDQIRFTPSPVTGLTNAIALSAGVTHTCALLVTGSVVCWGANGFGQLGVGNTDARSTPGPTVSSLTDVAAIAAGRRFTCARRAKGEVLCWGFNESGQLGNDSTSDSSLPVQVLTPIPPSGAIGPLTGADLLTTGFSHACVTRPIGGRSRCWGSNASGQLGIGSTGTGSDIAVEGQNVSAIGLTAGQAYTCAVTGEERVLCWGENGSGQLGEQTTNDRPSPTAAAIVGGINARGVTAGLKHSCAVRASGGAACWGRNFFGELGDGTREPRHVPTPVAFSTPVATIGAGNSHTCASTHTDGVACWGLNSDSQSDPFHDEPLIIPGVTAVTASHPFHAATGGLAHTCFLRVGGGSESVTCQGSDASGQLGGEPDADRASVAFEGGVALAIGSEHSCALRANGTVFCWGLGTSGQLGNGQSVNRPTPVQVSGITDAVAIAAGAFHTCAVLVSGVVRCWGLNDFGQLGDGTTGNRSLPSPVQGLVAGDAVAIAAGRTHTCLRTPTGGVRCWGDNGRGQLGNSTTADSTSPVTVRRFLRLSGKPPEVVSEPLSNVIAVAAGTRHACAVRAAGQVVCWGANEDGQLGDDSTTDRLVAVNVGSFVANIHPQASVARRGRKVDVTALVSCEEHGRAKVQITLEQEGVSGHGSAVVKCTGGLAAYPLQVHAQGREGFEPGPAIAHAVIDVRDGGTVLDHQEWTRQIVLAPED